MNRYVIYRCPEGCDCHQKLKEHELIGATTGNRIEDAIAEIFEQARIDLQSIQPTEFQDGDVEFNYLQDESRSRKYQYSFEARLFPNSSLAPTNPWRQYAIQEIPMK